MALHIKRYVDPAARILMADRSAKEQNDRTWAFWSADPLPLQLDGLSHHRWDTLSFYAPGWERHTPAAPFSYQYIRALDYYDHLRGELQRAGGVYWMIGDIAHLGSRDHEAYLWINGKEFTGDWLFDSVSRPRLSDLRAEGYYGLWQQFAGWRIKTRQPRWSPDRATLMDFRLSQQAGTAFGYVLPFAEDEALLEYTRFGEDLHPDSLNRERLRRYLREQWGLTEYTILEEEKGAIPMTDAPLAVRPQGRVVPIGTAAGAVKPSTGYAFVNIQRQTAALARQLREEGTIVGLPARRGRFAWYDQLLLHLLTGQPERSREIFSGLFRRQTAGQVLTFLDEATTPWEEARLFSHLPVGLFLRAAWANRQRSAGGAKVPGLVTNALK
jgi:lycopene beta-cyclase